MLSHGAFRCLLGIEDLIISGWNVIAQAVYHGAAVLDLEMTSGCRDGKDNLVTELQATITTILVGNVSGTVHVYISNTFTESEAIKNDFRCGIFFFHTSSLLSLCAEESLRCGTVDSSSIGQGCNIGRGLHAVSCDAVRQNTAAIADTVGLIDCYNVDGLI